MQRGDLLRFDVVIPKPTTPSTTWSPFPPQNTRTLLDGQRSVTYDVSADSVVIDKQSPAAVNPIAILYRFEPEPLYRFRGQVLHERLKIFLSMAGFRRSTNSNKTASACSNLSSPGNAENMAVIGKG